VIARAAIVAEARSWIDTPYRHQASLKGVGCDCLGLARGVWRAFYSTEPEPIPAYSRDWAEARGEETLAIAAGRHMTAVPPADMRAGDLLIFALNSHAPAKHCAILVTPDRMVHGIEAHPVAEVSLGSWWRRHIRFVFAFPGVED
jgi:NlpC/P60 family putative phage cell wall peptidase